MVRRLMIVMLMIGLVTGPALTASAIENAGASSVTTPSPVPKDVSATTLVVFGLRPTGDANAKYYALAFADALAARVYCAPDNLTQQYATGEVWAQIGAHGGKVGVPPSDVIAKKAAQELGVRYMVTGDLALVNGVVTIQLKMTNVTALQEIAPLKVSGPLTDLARLQPPAARWIVDGMKLVLTPNEETTIAKPNFTNAEAMLLYGRGCYATGVAEQAPLLWQAVEEDSSSLFTVLRIVEFCAGNLNYEELQNEKRLTTIVNTLQPYGSSPDFQLLKVALLRREGCYNSLEYGPEAQLRNNPNMCRAHALLAGIAVDRQDGQTAIREGKALVAMWPSNASYHALLAKCYAVAADNARHCHFFGEMTPEFVKKWETNNNECLNEASKAVALNPNCASGWSQLRLAALGNGLDDQRLKAFRELLRLDPRDFSAYLGEATSLLPQWGGTQQERDALVAKAGKTFGPDSYEVTFIKLWLASEGLDEKKDWKKILQMADEAVKKSGNKDGRALYWKCQLIDFTGKAKELSAQRLEWSKLGYNRYHSPDWLKDLGKTYMLRYSATYTKEKPDAELYNQACKCLYEYTQMVPFDPDGHKQLAYCLSGDPKRAIVEYRKALALDPADSWSREQLKTLSPDDNAKEK
jgi:tetratricopeptide (TPR) repeat protein